MLKRINLSAGTSGRKQGGRKSATWGLGLRLLAVLSLSILTAQPATAQEPTEAGGGEASGIPDETRVALGATKKLRITLTAQYSDAAIDAERVDTWIGRKIASGAISNKSSTGSSRQSFDFTITAKAPGKTSLVFDVKTTRGVHTSGWRQGVPVTVHHAAPTNLRVGDRGTSGLDRVPLLWDAPANATGIIGYQVRWVKGTGAGIDDADWSDVPGGATTSHAVTGLEETTRYAFQVRAAGGDADDPAYGDPSAILRTRTPFPVPTGLTATSGAVNRAGRSFASNSVEATPVAPQVFTLDFPHFANGGGITSEVVLLNAGAKAIRPVLYFSDRQGQAIDTASVVDMADDLEVQQDGGGLTMQTQIEPLGELPVSTHGRGDDVSGSVRVVAHGAIGGVLRYSVPMVGVTGVGAGTPVRDALFPARRKQGGLRTAAAMHNPGEEEIEVTCRLMSGGAVLEEAEISLKANGQTSWFIEEAFTETDTADFVGTVRCTASRQGRFTGLAVEVDAANRIFTTLPVVPVERPAGEGGETVLYFAHFANGGNSDEGGIRSDLVFVNVETEASRPALTPFHRDIPASRPVIYFYDQKGRLIDPESVVDLMDGLEVTDDGALTIKAEMAPLGELTITTHGRGEEVSGSVKVVSEGAIGGVLRYSVPGVGVTGVGAGPPVGDALFPARRKRGGIRTAAAMRNLEEDAIELTCRLMSGGVVLEEAEIPLEANGQTSWFIEEAFAETDTTDFVGTVRCTAPEGRTFTGLAVEVDGANRIFTTLPVVEVQEQEAQPGQSTAVPAGRPAPAAAQPGRVVVAGSPDAAMSGDDEYVLNNAAISGDTLLAGRPGGRGGQP